jgi:hypothetical protein
MASGQGGHFHRIDRLGSPRLTTLPCSAEERLLALFPFVPILYANEHMAHRVSDFVDAKRNATIQGKSTAESQHADACLMEISRVEDRIREVLDEEFMWEGVSVRGSDILRQLSQPIPGSDISLDLPIHPKGMDAADAGFPSRAAGSGSGGAVNPPAHTQQSQEH